MRRLYAAAFIAGCIGWGWIGYAEISAQSASDRVVVSAIVSADDTLVPAIDTTAPVVGASADTVASFDNATVAVCAKKTAESSGEIRVNINTATVADLDRLPGVGPAIAGRILSYRAVHGTLTSPEDLLAVKGIGEKTLDKIRGNICF